MLTLLVIKFLYVLPILRTTIRLVSTSIAVWILTILLLHTILPNVVLAHSINDKRIIIQTKQGTSKPKAPKQIKKKSTSRTIKDSSSTQLKPNVPPFSPRISDSTRQKLDSLDFDSTSAIARVNPSGIDTVIVYTANDTISLFSKQRKLRLRGDAEVNYHVQKLEAEVIEIFFDQSLMKASGIRDSVTGIAKGFPKFTDKDQTFVGETINYNFKTKAGTVSLGETSVQNGFYYGSKIKKVNDNTLFVQDGCFTTCDHPQPHFYFSSPKMKVITGESIFLNDLYVYVQDIPIFYLPIGMYFPNRGGGRQSGIIIPRPFVSANRGVVFENLGYFWAINDNWGSQFSLDIFSKGGVRFRNRTDFNFRYITNGSLDISYAYTRQSPSQPFSRDFSISGNANLTLIPNTTTFTTNFRIISNSFISNISNSLSERLQQNITSFAGISHSFQNGVAMSLNYTRDQNVVTKSVTQTLPLSLTIPNTYPLKNLVASNNWLSDISINPGTVGINYSHFLEQLITPRDTNQAILDTTLRSRYIARADLAPSINISPKLGAFTIQPSINFRASFYTRRIARRSWNTSTRTTSDSLESGLYGEYNISYGLSARTTLFSSPLRIGNIALRHTIAPQISISYTPDLSDISNGFYNTYIQPSENKQREQTVRYSRYAQDGGGFASQSRQLNIGYSLENVFMGKVYNDTSESRFELPRINLSGSYNAIADSLRFSDVSWSIRMPSLTTKAFSLSLNGGLTTTLYSEAENTDTNGTPIGTYRRINSFYVQESGVFGALGRMTNANATLSITIGNQQSQQNTTFADQFGTDDSTEVNDDSTAGDLDSRFARRMNSTVTADDIFGQSYPGFTPLVIPWNAVFNLQYNYNQQFAALASQSTFNATVACSFSFTPTWSVRTGLGYDLRTGQINSPNVTVTKQIHCWNLSLDWYPTGFNQGFYLRFAANASMLQDLKIEKRSLPVFR